MAEEVLTLKVQMESARTQRELEQLRAKATAFRKDQVIGSKEFVSAAKVEVDIKNKLHTLNVQAYSDNARLKESYFKLGAEIRQHRHAVLGLAGSLGADKTALGGVLMALAGPGGWIAATTAAIGALAFAFKQAGDNVDELRKKAAQLEARTPQAELALVQKELAEIGANPAPKPYGPENPYASVFQQEEYEKKRVRKLELLREEERLNRAILDILNERQSVEDAMFYKSAGASPGKFSPNDVQMGFVGPQTYGDYASGQIGQHGGASTGGLSAYKGSIPGIDQTWGSGQKKLEIIGAAESLKGDLQPAWDGIAASIISTIGGAFAAVFSGAKFDVFSLLGSVLSIAGLATGQLWLAAAGGAVGQFGGGGNLTAGGGGGSTSHAGIRRGGDGSAIGREIVSALQAGLYFDGVGLALATSAGNRQLRDRTL